MLELHWIPLLIVALFVVPNKCDHSKFELSDIVKEKYEFRFQVVYHLDRDNTSNKINLTHMMNMSESSNISITIQFNKQDLLSMGRLNAIEIKFNTYNFEPQFPILELNETSKVIRFTRQQLEDANYSPDAYLKIHASYIGHAFLAPNFLLCNYQNRTIKEILSPTSSNTLGVTVVQYEGIWGTIFIVSVSVFIIMSYINLGAQLDTERIKQILTKPLRFIFGLLITVLVMPFLSVLICGGLLPQRPLYSLGSFIFACCPSASASTLWTAMLDSDKELSVALQVASTLGSLVTMPMLLFWMPMTQVPYARIFQTLLALTLALFVGWRFIGRNERAQKISRQMFRPLTFFVLIFIIVFSSVIYWYIYRMFNWQSTLASLVITLSTYTIAGLLGYLMNQCNLEHAVAISISSTYKNSGIAFAVLLVAFERPDAYIAYVPCLTQVVTTSISLYLVYSVLSLIKCFRRRGQPAAIQATTEDGDNNRTKRDDEEGGGDSGSTNRMKDTRSGSDSSVKSIRRDGEENDEFIAMNVTDVVPGSPQLA